MAYKCPDCNTNFFGKVCPTCRKRASECMEISYAQVQAERAAAQAAEQGNASVNETRQVGAQAAENREDTQKKKEKAGGEGQTVCPKCGRVFEGLFCPFCGYGAEEAGIERLEDEEVAAQEEAFRQEDKRAEEEKKREEQEQAAEKAEEEAVASGEKTKCPKCGKVVEGTFCPYCGTQVQQQNKCPHCGTERAKDAKFCPVCGYDYVNNTFAKQYYAFKRERRENAGKIVKQKFSAAVSSAKVHKKRVITAVLTIAVILAIVVPVSVVFTSPVQPANVDRINIGDTQAHVVSVLGDPYNYKKGDTTFTYYSDNYLNIRKQLDEIADMDDIGSFSDLADAIEKEEELNQKLETLEYKRTTVTFDEGGLVTKIVYNASIVDNVSQPKELKSQEVITESVRIYEVSDVVYTLKYDDGSIYKSIASVTADTSNKFLFEVYDPFSESGAKISMECSVVENPDVTYIVGEEGATYLLDQYGNLTISGSGSVTSSDISRFDKSEIKQVTIGGNITEIGEGAFSGCALMTSVSIPDSVTKVGRNAFSDCSSLTYRTYDDVRYLGNEGNPYLVAVGIADISAVQFNIHANARVIADYAFAGNTVLRAAYIPDGSVKYIGARAFYDCTSMTGITLGNGVENIGDNAFYNCSSLVNAIMPDSTVSIGSYAFYNCDGLTSVNIPNSVTSIGEYVFNDCSGLESVNISSSVTELGRDIFYNCRNLTQVNFNGDISAWLNFLNLDNGSQLVSSDRTIYIDSQIPSGEIVIPEGITTIPSRAFYNFTKVTSVTIPNSVTSIGGYAFYGCSGLTSITIPDSVISIGYGAIIDCNILHIYCEAISRPDGWSSYWNANNCPVIWDCKNNDIANDGNIYYTADNGVLYSLKDGVATVQHVALSGDVIIPVQIVYNETPYIVTNIESGAFSDCSGLISITIPNSVTMIPVGVFRACIGLESITIPFVGAYYNNYHYQYFGSIFGSTESDNRVVPSTLKEVVITGGTSIGSRAFSGCSGLTSITIGGSVTSIESYAFSGCSGLTSITIGGSVTSIGEDAFYGCNSLKEVHISDVAAWCAIDFDGITDNPLSIGAALYFNGKLATSLEIPDSVTNIGSYAFSGVTAEIRWESNPKITEIGEYAFAGYSGIGIIIPNSVTSIGRSAFSGCNGLTNITIPDSVTCIGEWAFYNCSGLTSITVPFVGSGDSSNIHFGYIFGASSYLNNSSYVPSTLKEVVITGGASIGSSAFEGCSGLTSITIPDSVTSIGDWAFGYCSGLTSITIPDSVTSIGGAAFYNCSGLTSITIPDSVTSIGGAAFYNCSGLTSITIPDSVTSIGYEAFRGCSGLTNVKFNGTMSQWNSIDMDYAWLYNTGNFTITCTDGVLDKYGNQI